ncbi:unnamed protein product [Darwinula stevensoni]|uniref:GST C-terminal domain-containing protein n=1 Tax=Darwinula stevensoni TaxID=69355 RepID=A0A7R8X668_9CRUS|nr:unnamed protein product [Darwinula stevensoni]CAG0886591.1 unnamed protein product [Darwinula stevensoni]
MAPLRMVSKTRARSYKSPNAALVSLKESKTKKSPEKKLPRQKSLAGKGEKTTRKEAKITFAASIQEDKQSPTREAEINRTFLSPQASGEPTIKSKTLPEDVLEKIDLQALVAWREKRKQQKRERQKEKRKNEKILKKKTTEEPSLFGDNYIPLSVQRKDLKELGWPEKSMEVLAPTEADSSENRKSVDVKKGGKRRIIDPRLLYEMSEKFVEEMKKARSSGTLDQLIKENVQSVETYVIPGSGQVKAPPDLRDSTQSSEVSSTTDCPMNETFKGRAHKPTGKETTLQRRPQRYMVSSTSGAWNMTLMTKRNHVKPGLITEKWKPVHWKPHALHHHRTKFKGGGECELFVGDGEPWAEAVCGCIGVREICELIASGIQPMQNLRVLQQLKEEERQPWAASAIVRGFNGISNCQKFKFDVKCSLPTLEIILSQSAGKYCVGDNVTMADCCLVPQVYNARRFNVDMSEYPIITRINEELGQLDAFFAAHPNAQPDAPPEFRS